MEHEQGEKRKYITGNQRIDIVVYQSLMALSFELERQADEVAADELVAAAAAWLTQWQRLDDAGRARWFDHYEELDHIQATLAVFGVDGPVR